MHPHPTLPESPTSDSQPTSRRDASGDSERRSAGKRAARRRRGQQLLLAGVLYLAAILTVAVAWLCEALSIPGWSITIDDPW
jgi:hypothetical protein